MKKDRERRKYATQQQKTRGKEQTPFHTGEKNNMEYPDAWIPARGTQDIREAKRYGWWFAKEQQHQGAIQATDTKTRRTSPRFAARSKARELSESSGEATSVDHSNRSPARARPSEKLGIPTLAFNYSQDDPPHCHCMVSPGLASCCGICPIKANNQQRQRHKYKIDTNATCVVVSRFPRRRKWWLWCFCSSIMGSCSTGICCFSYCNRYFGRSLRPCTSRLLCPSQPVWQGTTRYRGLGNARRCHPQTH